MREDEFANEMFKRTMALNDIARELFLGKISLTKFDKLFNIGLSDTSNIYRKFFIQKVLDSLSKNKNGG